MSSKKIGKKRLSIEYWLTLKFRINSIFLTAELKKKKKIVRIIKHFRGSFCNFYDLKKKKKTLYTLITENAFKYYKLSFILIRTVLLDCKKVLVTRSNKKNVLRDFKSAFYIIACIYNECTIFIA